MAEVFNRHKDVLYSSRIASQIAQQQKAHRLRHVIKELAKHIPDEVRTREDVRELTSYGCLTRMHFVRLLWPGHENEDHTKDVDFTLSGIKKRWQAGYEQTMRAIDQAPWQREVDPLAGVFLHEPQDTVALEEMASTDALPSQIAAERNSRGRRLNCSMR